MGQDESLDADRVAFGLCGRHTSTDDLRPALSGVRGERGGITGGSIPPATLTINPGVASSVR